MPASERRVRSSTIGIVENAQLAPPAKILKSDSGERSARGAVCTSVSSRAIVASALFFTQIGELNVMQRLALGRSFTTGIAGVYPGETGRIDTDPRIGTIGTSD
jgi:hypothetical protein